MDHTRFDDPVVEKDLVLIHINDQPAFYARVEGFEPDHKPNWWHVKLLALLFPPQLITWILRREQINGEPFTMQGTPIRIEKVKVPQETAADPEPEPQSGHEVSDEPAAGEGKQARILSLGDRKDRD